jgi:hypothetical protein
VVGGQSLVKQAKLRSVVTDFNKYKLAINAFKLEYDAIPGDFSRASDYGIGTSGNGDKQIISAAIEGLAAWNHLSNAKIVPGSFSGGWPIAPSTNAPATPFGGLSIYFFTHSGPQKIGGDNVLNNGQAPVYQTYRGNLIVAAAYSNTDSRPWQGIMSAKDASSIDQKMDNGIPDTGNILVTLGMNGIGGCVDKNHYGTSPVTFLYNNQAKSCRVYLTLD